MINTSQFLLTLFLLSFLGCTCSVVKPLDIRNDYLKKKLQQSDYKKGKTLLLKMEDAYGGKENWLAYEKGTFVQRADWYGRKKISGWDTIPQLFEMTSFLGTENCELTLLNGKNKGTKWGIQDGNFYSQKINQEKNPNRNNHQIDKLLFKNYWFQFPFRVGEAAIISYAGKGEIEGKQYDLIYATWGSEKANKDYDQFLLFLNEETHFVEYLHFTVREKFSAISFTARFDEFKKVNNLVFPFAQYVTQGKPQKSGMKMHENHYVEIKLDEVK